MHEIKFGRARLADALFQAGVFLRKSESPDGRGFRLRSHDKDPTLPHSPFFLDLHTTTQKNTGPVGDELLDLAAIALKIMVEKRGLRFDGLCGVPSGGTPYAEALAHKLSLPIIYLLKTSDGFHIDETNVCNRRLRLLRGKRVALVEDVISTGGSVIRAARALAPYGVRVLHGLAIFDREQGGLEYLGRESIKGHVIYSIREFLHFLHFTAGVLPEAEFEEYWNYVETERKRLGLV